MGDRSYRTPGYTFSPFWGGERDAVEGVFGHRAVSTEVMASRSRSAHSNETWLTRFFAPAMARRSKEAIRRSGASTKPSSSASGSARLTYRYRSTNAGRTEKAASRQREEFSTFPICPKLISASPFITRHGTNRICGCICSRISSLNSRSRDLMITRRTFLNSLSSLPSPLCAA